MAPPFVPLYPPLYTTLLHFGIPFLHHAKKFLPVGRNFFAIGVYRLPGARSRCRTPAPFAAVTLPAGCRRLAASPAVFAGSGGCPKRPAPRRSRPAPAPAARRRGTRARRPGSG